MRQLLTKADPRFKLIWCLVLIVFAFTAQHILTEAVLLALIIITDLLFAKDMKHYKLVAVLLFIVGTQIFFIQLIFNREGIPIFSWWVIHIYSGALPAAVMGALRTMVISCGAIQFISRTSAQEGELMLLTLGVPHRYAALVGMTERFFPLLKAEYAAIVQSLAVRGVETNGVWHKIKALPPTFLPFLYRGVRRSSEVALAMEIRGFGRSKQRTTPYDLHLSVIEIVLGFMLILILLLNLLFFHY